MSVLTATFNRRATFLPQCLDSVRHQVGDGFTHEHIVVDDCSADGTWITSSKPPGRIRALFVEPTAAACWAALKAGLIDVGPQADDRPRAVAPLCGTGLKSKPRRPEGSLAP